MTGNWIALQSIPSRGSILQLDDQALWEGPIQEFGMVCRIVDPLRAEVTIFPQEKGVLFRGRITGTVALPCNRCTEDSLAVINHAFDSFEPLPADPLRDSGEEDEEALEADEAVIRVAPGGGSVEVNPAALVWEEFSLALPVNPLCGEYCKGLCPACGCNGNQANCSCAPAEGDPRLAALRGLTVNGKK